MLARPWMLGLEPGEGGSERGREGGREREREGDGEA